MKSFNIVMRKDCLRMKRIGMLTSGGDCQALNAAMRGVVKGLSENVDELEIYGFTMDTKAGSMEITVF